MRVIIGSLLIKRLMNKLKDISSFLYIAVYKKAPLASFYVVIAKKV